MIQKKELYIMDAYFIENCEMYNYNQIYTLHVENF